MLKIKSVRYKNFLSSGNNWIEVIFDDARTILACGSNGSGKSTILSALIFGLYGKDFRGIKKGGLVNSINKKDALVEVQFSIGGADYKIIRGIKPDILEIYKNDELLASESKKADQVMVDGILKFPYGTFKQIVVTGSGEYVPFMKLTKPLRRDFIDNFLETDVFATMKSLLKAKNDILTDEIKDIKKTIDLFNEQIKFIKKIRLEQSVENSGKRKEYFDSITNLNSEVDELKEKEAKVREAVEKITAIYDKITIADKHVSNFGVQIDGLKSRKRQLSAKYDRIEGMHSCPSCYQDIGESHKEKIRCENVDEISGIESDMVPLLEKIEKLAPVLAKKADTIKKLNELNSALSTINSAVSSKNSSISHYNNLITELDKPKVSEERDVDDIQNKLNEALVELNEKTEKQTLYTYGGVLLKDDGIKSVIVKKYVEILNELINAYLTKFDFYVNFTFDENFNETIKARHRDAFTYENFSEGEKARIDLSILFAFRSLAKMRSNLDCSILIIDEVMDSAMDANGVDDLRNIFDIFEELNIFIISHREKASELFDKTIEFKKVGQFSQMSIVN